MIKKVILILCSIVLMGCYAYKQICMQEYTRPEKISVDDELEVLVFKLYYREYDKRDEIIEERAVKLELEPQYRAEFIKMINDMFRHYDDHFKGCLGILVNPMYDNEYRVIFRLNGKEIARRFCLLHDDYTEIISLAGEPFNAKKYIKASSWAKLRAKLKQRR